VDERNGSEFAALAAQVDELRQVCARLSQENTDLREEMFQLRSRSSRPASHSRRRAGQAVGAGDGTGDGTVSRRMMGKALGAAAAGVVGAVALAEASASPAAAADGDSVTAGHTTNAESATTVNFDGSATAPGIVFLANDTSFAASDATFSAALGGWAATGHVGNGVYGYTQIPTGSGVVGEIGGLTSGGSGVHGVAHDPNTVGVKAENSRGAAVQADGGSVGVSATGTTAVHAAGKSVGVTASGAAIAVRAIGAGSAGVGINGSGGGAGGRGGVFSGAAAQAQLIPGTLASHPKSGSRGDLYADKTGRLWFCKKTGNPALWHQIA
jgi:hypothetical protein